MKRGRLALLIDLPTPSEDRPPKRNPPKPGPVALLLHGQSRASLAVAFLIGMFLVVLFLDPPVHQLALSLDPDLRSVLRTLTRLGNSAWPLGFGLLAFAVLRLLLPQARGRAKVALRRAQACVLLLMTAVAGSGLLASLFKNMIGRARPTMPEGGVFDFSVLAFQPGWASFPSGHATTAMAMMTVLAMIWPRHALAPVFTGALIALTRGLIGVHWLSDVLAGMTLGALVTLDLRQRIDGQRRRALLSPAMAALAAAALRDGGQNIWHHGTDVARSRGTFCLRDDGPQLLDKAK